MALGLAVQCSCCVTGCAEPHLQLGPPLRVLTVFRPDADLLSGPSPGGSSPVQKSKLQGEQIQQLKAELRAAQDGCLSEKRRAGEYLAQLQTRGEYILLLQSQLNDLQQDNTALRQQLAAPGASSNGDHAAGNHLRVQPEVSVVPRSEHEAVVQQLTEQIQQLRLELAANSTAALAPPTTPRAEAAAAGTGSGSGSGSVSTDDLATHIDTARAASAASDASSPAAAAAAAAALSAHAQEVASQQHLQVLQQQYEDLTVFVKQLEAQAAQREALMGGLLAQVGGSCVGGGGGAGRWLCACCSPLELGVSRLCSTEAGHAEAEQQSSFNVWLCPAADLLTHPPLMRCTCTTPADPFQGPTAVSDCIGAAAQQAGGGSSAAAAGRGNGHDGSSIGLLPGVWRPAWVCSYFTCQGQARS